jgi:hypothetical protein
MQLRDHPLMFYRGVRNWPPVWTRIRGREDKHPMGEVGILREVRWSALQFAPLDRFFLVIDFERTVYMGCLLFDDAAFCLGIQHLLRDHCGSDIEYIGGLDISHLQ